MAGPDERWRYRQVRVQADPVEGFYNVLSTQGIKVTPQVNITSVVFLGTSFTAVSDDGNIPVEVAALEGVSRIWPVSRIPRTIPEIHEVGRKAVVAITTLTPPPLGGGFGPAFKVVGGIDVVGDNYEGTNFFPDPDPYDCSGHGTHVAGIVAGEDKNFIGVAPRSKLLSYKVFGCRCDGTGQDVLIQAFVQDYGNEADIINASIGGPGGFPRDAWATASSRILQQGIFTISPGNSGDRGLFYASSGATGVDIMSVALITNEEYFAFKTEGYKKDIAYFQSGVEEFKLAGSVPVYVTSLDKFARNDACATLTLPEDTPDLSRYLVVFNIKEKNLVDKNATYIWLCNTPKTPINGEFIVEQFASGGKATLNFLQEPQGVGINNTSTEGKMLPFTSWVPSFEAQFKSEISSPGGYIYSTIPVKQGSYAVFSGTSMASPSGSTLPEQVWQSQAARLCWGYRTQKLYDLERYSSKLEGQHQDGSHKTSSSSPSRGWLRERSRRLTNTTTISPGRLELNDTKKNFKPEHTRTVRNSGNQEATYTFTHEVSRTVNTFKRGSKVSQMFLPTFVNGSAALQFLPQNMTIPAHSNGTFKVAFTPPKDLKTTQLLVYSGKVVVTSYGETLSIPHQGIHGNLRDLNIWKTEQFPFIASYLTGNKIRGLVTVTLSGGDLLTAVFANTFGTPVVRWDVVTEYYDTNKFLYPPIAGERGFVGSVRTLKGGVDFPIFYAPRHDPLGMEFSWFNWGGGSANGSSRIANGGYQFVSMMLRVAGDRRKVEDWETVATKVVTIASKP
ncbi:unnamed protein product [Tuber aestivum]|uniref:Peptidase S8/S53 domain-containing protein n=1 Tax=Tuber aestivum TaxID=59557 RepID=A0A292PWS4_9PEZI|nr:unnamed protein product [Tuber aestivum]